MYHPTPQPPTPQRPNANDANAHDPNACCQPSHEPRESKETAENTTESPTNNNSIITTPAADGPRPDVEVDWSRTEVGRVATDAATAVHARRHCPPNTLGITPEQVHGEALARMWRQRSEVDVHDVDGYVRSRLAYAYRTLCRQRVAESRHERATDPAVLAGEDGAHPAVAESRPGSDPLVGLVDAEWIRDAQLVLTRRVSELQPTELARARALATLLTLLAIAANGGCLPAAVPERSGRLEDGEIDLLAATWMADPRLRGAADRPDDAAIRKRRQRLVETVRAELRELCEELSGRDASGHMGAVDAGTVQR